MESGSETCFDPTIGQCRVLQIQGMFRQYDRFRSYHSMQRLYCASAASMRAVPVVAILLQASKKAEVRSDTLESS